MAGIRDFYLGRLGLPTLFDDVKEGVGSPLNSDTGGVVLAKKRTKGYSLNAHVWGTSGDLDQYAAGERMRRQVRALLDNDRARADGMYMMSIADPSLNGWIMLGQGQLDYSDGGVSLAQYKLTLDEMFRLGSLRTHREGRRATLVDRRLSTTQNDYLGWLVGGLGFAGATAQSIVCLPNCTDVVVNRQALSKATTYLVGGINTTLLGQRQQLDQNNPQQAVLGRVNGEIIHYNRTEAMQRSGDVVAYDRQGVVPLPADTNWFGNPVPAASLTNWPAGGTRVTTGGPPQMNNCAYGWYSLAGNTTLASASGLVWVNGEVVGYGVWLRAHTPADVGKTVRIRITDGTTTGSTNVVLTAGWTFFGGTVTATSTTLGGTWGVDTGGGLAAAAYDVTGFISTRNALTATPPNSFDPDTQGSWGGTQYASQNYLTDYQSALGWEELYGPDQTTTLGDVPVISNGQCRVRYVPAVGAWAVDDFVAGTGLVEQGRFMAFADTGSGAREAITLVDSAVLEWTQERAVIRAVMQGTGVAADARVSIIITLQRGWTGPRVEVYTRASVISATPSAVLHYAPAVNSETVFAFGFAGGNATESSSSPSFTWNCATFVGSNSWASGTINYCALLQPTQGNILPAHFAVIQLSASVTGSTSTLPYGAARFGIQFTQAVGASPSYVQVQLGNGTVKEKIVEAETIMNAAGTRTLVADASAFGAGNNAVNDTQTASTADTLSDASGGPLNGLAPGTYGIWARVRSTVAADQISVSHVFSGITTNTTPVVLTVGTAYSWYYLGEAQLTSGSSPGTFSLRAWRSSGTGNARVDRVMAVRQTGRMILSGTGISNDYSGLRDHGESSLYESRPEPTLLER